MASCPGRNQCTLANKTTNFVTLRKIASVRHMLRESMSIRWAKAVTQGQFLKRGGYLFWATRLRAYLSLTRPPPDTVTAAVRFSQISELTFNPLRRGSR
jgi:hypothetical protein